MGDPMTAFERTFPTTRRRVLQLLALLGLGGSEAARTAAALAAPSNQADPVWPEMTYRILGRTGFDGSRLVFGCGAALMLWGKDDPFLGIELTHRVDRLMEAPFTKRYIDRCGHWTQQEAPPAPPVELSERLGPAVPFPLV